MWWGILAAAILIAFLNARRAKQQGYFFWRTLFFTLILEAAVLAILYKNLNN
jgi:hypothetical protein